MRWYTNSALQTMVIVDGPVKFRMGSPPSDPYREGAESYHWRTISGRFAVSAKEVTVEEFQTFAVEKRGAPHEYNRTYSPDPHGPVIDVTWFDGAAYCNWLSDREHLPRCYRAKADGKLSAGVEIDREAVEGGGYRFLTEAEWEYACRAGTVTSRYFGGMPELLGQYEWFMGNSRDCAQPCGMRLPNDLGLFDMLGNVQEWCHDTYVDSRPGPEDVVADTSPIEILAGDWCYIRGQTSFQSIQALRSAIRIWKIPSIRRSDMGFRVGRRIPDRP
jgi:formylglycine-generating enzyme required for sulfatase activity